MDESELFAKRASSFGANAAAYAQHRPGYPAEAIEWVIGDRMRVLDLAAGTGRLTEGLLAFGLEVTAVEPDEAMRAELTRRIPDVPALDGSAEDIPLPDASVEAVLVGHAFHWFNTDKALTEITRVLRPGGVFGALWNHDDLTVDWVAGLAELTATSLGEVQRVKVDVPSHDLLEPHELKTFPHRQRRTVESLLATLGTHSQISVADATERAQVFDRVRTYLWSRPETSAGEFDRPLITSVVRAIRR
ncbi:class I SAM-dependent methyltransferase [Actinokineospora iranica]|uniref:Methyltransferase domain-containing protein n=1 Tax=Actinokineospora iranica TaxID=1271860 RepID=A0A1G6Y0S0_9PSEU|nr:class I SAM-dependent methyltransferase [Actinokineospora iranica]SDD83226.1 Methyltransferase domain-containing protein [Actinokineospora iranica]